MQRPTSDQKGGRSVALQAPAAGTDERQALFMLAYVALAAVSLAFGVALLTGTGLNAAHSPWLGFVAIAGVFGAWRTASPRWRASLWSVMGLSRR